jgi:hypothetical protein
MGSAPVPLAEQAYAQRAQACARYEILRPAPEVGVQEARSARLHQIPRGLSNALVARLLPVPPA